MSTPRQGSRSRKKCERNNSSAESEEMLAALSSRSGQKLLMSARSISSRNRVRATSAMRINAYAIPLRERIVIISNRGRYFKKYTYKNSNMPSEGLTDYSDSESKRKVGGKLREDSNEIKDHRSETQLPVEKLLSKNLYSKSKNFMGKVNSVLDSPRTVYENLEKKQSGEKKLFGKIADEETISEANLSNSSENALIFFDNLPYLDEQTQKNSEQKQNLNISKNSTAEKVIKHKDKKTFQLSIKSIWRECLRNKNHEIRNHVEHCRTCSHLNEAMLTLSRQSLLTDKYPHYQSEANRRESFALKKDLDEINDVSGAEKTREMCENKLIEEGFFYDSEEGKVHCFSCGLTKDIGNIEEQASSKLHLNSGLFCAHKVKSTISMLINACKSGNQSHVMIIKDLCDTIIMTGLHSWNINANNDCPWVCRAKNNSLSDIFRGVLEILQFTGSTNDQSSFLNRLLTFSEDCWDPKVILLSQNGLFCTDRIERKAKCCACNLEIYDYKEDLDPWKEHIKHARRTGKHRIKCSFIGVDMTDYCNDNLENSDAILLNNLDDADWYPVNGFWHCKHCQTNLIHIEKNLGNDNLWKLHILKNKDCEFLKRNVAPFFVEFVNNVNNVANRKKIIENFKQSFTREELKQFGEAGFQEDKGTNQCFCFCCLKRFALSQKVDKIWDMHIGRGLYCEYAVLEMPEELLYRLEYKAQYNVNDDSNQHIEALVKRRINFSQGCKISELNFGTIYFQDEYKSQRLLDANYVICSKKDDADKLIKCLKDCKETHYSCIISVFGLHNYPENINLKNFFDTMIYIYRKLNSTKGILFLTEGINTCSMQMLGDAVFECQTLPKQAQDNEIKHVSPFIKAIGIVRLDADCLFYKQQRNRIEVQVKPCLETTRCNQKNFDIDESVSLNPNHTEFIFIKDTTKDWSPLSYESRYKIHKHILSILSIDKIENNDYRLNEETSCSTACYRDSNKMVGDDKAIIPPSDIFSAIIIIGGSENIIEVINKTLTESNSRNHVIIFNETGGVAEELAKIYCESISKLNEPQYRNEMHLKNADNSKTKKDQKEIFRQLCIYKRSQITVINLSSTSSFAMHIFAIFFSIFEAQLKQLHLLKQSNSSAFKEKFQTFYVTNFSNMDIKANDFMKENLSANKLEKLKKCLSNQILKYIGNKTYDELQWPFETLFIWAILTDRHSFAKFFLGNCKNIVVMSLIAAYLYRLKRIQSSFYETNYKKQVKELKESYEDTAIGVIDQAYLVSGLKNEVFQTLQEKQELLSMNSCIEAAARAKCKRIFKTDAFGNMIDTMWYSDNTKVAYMAEHQQSSQEIIRLKQFPFYLCCDDKGIHVAPITKFSISLVFFVIFLIYYITVLLLLYEGESTIALEGIIFAWIVGFASEEIYEIVQTGSIRSYFGKSRYNILDVFIIFIGFTAFFLGLDIPKSYDFAKYFYWFNGVLLIFRLFREFAAFKSLGPKLTMIFIMMKQLGEFSFILVAVLTLFSISYSLFPSSNEDISFFKPFFLINQMIYDFDEISQAQQACFTNNTSAEVDNSENYCAAFVLKFITSATFIYVVNLMIINFIIALFASVYDTYAAKSEQLWRLGFYRLIEKYASSPILPSPLCIIEIIIYVLYFAYYKLKQNQVSDKPKENFNRTHVYFDEQKCYKEYLESLSKNRPKE